MNIRKKLIALSLVTSGDWFSMYQRIRNDVELHTMSDSELMAIKKLPPTVQVMTILDEDYPDELKEISNPPFVLYYQGNISLLNKKRIGVMGAKRPSTYGIKSCQDIVSDLLTSDRTIVSGLGLGVESIAHFVSLRRGSTIAVLGSGFNYIYPQENYELFRNISTTNLVITEYPPHVKPTRNQILFRNRIIAALSNVLIFIELRYKSGSMHAAQKAINEGKAIYALPGNYNSIHSDGSLQLIKQGAKCLTDVKEVALELGH
ncbi:MAG: DNA-processing protein DprA [Turicibacter sp.]